ncbi:hypothetical protein [Pyrococcus kukulkanii]|uniref:hypothetical protein n=1 Tax=Pyrococcus kukulkanii TaxID=1609559 RepID=UPI0035688854
MASRTELVYRDRVSVDDAFTYFKRLVRDAENRVKFSRALQRARRGLGVHMYVTDIDSLIFQYLSYRNVRGFRFTAFELKNVNPRKAIVDGMLKVNGKQYQAHYWLSKMAGIDFYYLVKANENFYIWNVSRIYPEFREHGVGDAKDLYAFIPLEDVIKVEEWELPGTLRLLLWGDKL